MKNCFIALLLLIAFSSEAKLVNDSSKNGASFRVTIKDSIGNTVKGYLVGFTDSTIMLSMNKLSASSLKNKLVSDYFSVHFKNIIEISIQKKGGVNKKVARTGFIVAGITAGTLYAIGIAILLGAKTPDWEALLTLFSPIIIPISFASGLLARAIAGGVSASKNQVNYIILGAKENFDRMKIDVVNRWHH